MNALKRFWKWYRKPYVWANRDWRKVFGWGLVWLILAAVVLIIQGIFVNTDTELYEQFNVVIAILMGMGIGWMAALLAVNDKEKAKKANDERHS